MDISFPTLKNNLRELRGGRSQAEFARLCGVPQQNIAKYELGKAVPGGEALLKISQACGKTIEWILTSKSVESTSASLPLTSSTNTAELVDLYKKNADQANSITKLSKLNYRHAVQNMVLMDDLRKLRLQIMALEYRLKNEGWDAPLSPREAKYSNAYKNGIDLQCTKLTAENIDLKQKLANAQRDIIPPGEDFNVPVNTSIFTNDVNDYVLAEAMLVNTSKQNAKKKTEK